MNRDHLLGKLHVAISQGTHQHVVVIVKNAHVLVVDKTSVGTAVGLCGVPEAGDQVTQDVGSFGPVGSEVELAI
jgi:hypothetical protein